MNKKGQEGIFIFMGIVFAIGIILALIFFVRYFNTPYQHGTSRDIVQGFDSGPLWKHAYLKNDHFTVYCFDDDNLIPILEQAQKTQKEVIITYEKYAGRGGMCVAADNYETVIIKSIEWAE